MLARLGVASVAFALGLLLFAHAGLRLLADLADRPAEGASEAFLSHSFTLSFLSLFPFLVVVAAGARRLSPRQLVLPSFVAGLTWIWFYAVAWWIAVHVLKPQGRQVPYPGGLLLLALVLVVPALLEYLLVLRPYMWLTSGLDKASGCRQPPGRSE